MRRFALVFVFMAASIPFALSAQTNVVNASKYAALRDRLRRDFLVMGTEPGMSLPAQERLPGDYIRWADGTIDLGWYIGVLGSEYALRSDPRFAGVDTMLAAIDTADELALALLALQRLDEQGDAAFPECGGMPALNGFFIRDDVPAGFHENFDGMTQTRSDFLDPPTLKEMSQDQVYHLLLGLSLAYALVPDNVQAHGISLSRNAREQFERIVRKMADDSWLIRNPACDRNVARGFSATAYSPGTAAAVTWVTDGEYVPETSDVAKGIWDLAKDSTSAFYTNADNLHMSMALAAVGQGWGLGETLSVLMELATLHRWYLYPLLDEVLHHSPNWCDYRDEAIGEARAMLDELPVGEFPMNPRPEVAVHGFTQWNRFIRGSDSHYVGPEGNDGREQHGLDYMLLHNLAALAAPELWGETGACVPPTGEDMGIQNEEPQDMGGEQRIDSGVPDSGPSMVDSVRPTDDDAGCSCTSTPTGHSPLWLSLLGVFAWRRRRQPKARP